MNPKVIQLSELIKEELLKGIVEAISELRNGERVSKLIKEAVSRGVPVMKIVEDGIRKGLEVVGKRYEEGEYFLSELLYAGDIVTEAFKELKPYLKPGEARVKARIVLGTVRGDIHDIGKNIFKMIAEADGFEVIDLGVDVEPERFVEKVRETRAEIVGLSALLTTTIPEMKKVIEALAKSGLRDRVKVILGGNAVTEEFGREIGADAVALNAVEGLEICRRWVEK